MTSPCCRLTPSNSPFAYHPGGSLNARPRPDALASLILGGAAGSSATGWRPASAPAHARQAAPAQPRRGLLPYHPAIDGLRALAVTAVLLYHAHVGLLPGGFLGVEVFFVISGYLITSILLADRATTGRVSLVRFWGRRARRLLPALFGLIIAALLYSVVFLPGEVASLRGDSLAGFGYVSNWYLIFDQQSYFESLGRPSLLRHLWSLAVEEQFYLLWPVVFALVLGRIRRRYAFALVLGCAAASAALMAILYDPSTDPSRVYYGTDTRAAGLLVGAALAFAWQIGRLPERVVRWTRYFPDVAGLIALAGVALIASLASEGSDFLYRGGFAIVAVFTALVIASCVHPGARVLPAVLGRQPFTWVGTRSYSIYLWHWPVFMLTRPELDVALDSWPLFIVRIALTAALAEGSFRFLEAPIRNGLLARAWASFKHARRPFLLPAGLRPLAAASGAGGGLVFLAMTVAAANPPPPPSYLAVPAVNIVSWSAPPAPTATRPPPSDTPSPPPTAEPASGGPQPVPSVPTSAPSAATASASPSTGVSANLPPLSVAHPRVFAVGDSVMLGAAGALAGAIGNAEVDAAVSRQVSDGVAVLEARQQAGTLGDAVVIHLGTNGSFTSWQFDRIMEVLAGVERVVFVNLRVPRDWESGDNATLAEGVARYQNAVLVDWHAVASEHPEYFYEDEIHLNPQGAAAYSALVAESVGTPPT